MSVIPDLIRGSFASPQSADTSSGGGSGTKVPASGDLDFSDPYDNLYAFGKLWASYQDTPCFPAFDGVLFAMVGDQRLKPLFRYCGFGAFQAKIMPSGNVRLRGKEVGYFSDLATGDILKTWNNPWTGETVEVFNFLNDRIRGEVTPVMPKFAMGEEGDLPTLMNEATAIVDDNGDHPFILPWRRINDNVLLEWDYTHRYRNPVVPTKWPKASTGEFINPSEHFTFFSSYKQLADRSNLSADYHCGFSRTGPWWPWMRMGASGVKGHVFGRMHSIKTNSGLDDISPKVLAYTEKHHRQFLEVCTDWDDGFPMGTWEAYAREVPPEI
ncbi:Uncharacterised protein [Halioglobus japonicus]|nr:Uncharacterised protein [Halioglobus japonicus]